MHEIIHSFPTMTVRFVIAGDVKGERRQRSSTFLFTFFIVTRDFCEGEIFKAVCSYDEVVVMRNAVYGRMRLNRCVKVDMGYLGCQSNVIDLADDKCSGRRTCEISIPYTTFENTQPCLELKSYLEASYDCMKGRHFKCVLLLTSVIASPTFDTYEDTKIFMLIFLAFNRYLSFCIMKVNRFYIIKRCSLL